MGFNWVSAVHTIIRLCVILITIKIVVSIREIILNVSEIFSELLKQILIVTEQTSCKTLIHVAEEGSFPMWHERIIARSDGFFRPASHIAATEIPLGQTSVLNPSQPATSPVRHSCNGEIMARMGPLFKAKKKRCCVCWTAATLSDGRQRQTTWWSSAGVAGGGERFRWRLQGDCCDAT